jgi:hypothetical protein
VSSDYKEKEKSEAEDMPPKKSMTKTPAKLSTPESSPKASSKPVEKVYTKNARKQNRQKETEKEKEKLKKVKEKEKQKEERKEKEMEKGNKVKETTLPKLGPGRPKKSDVTLGKSDGVSSKSTISEAEDKGKCRITFDQLHNTCCLLRLLPVSFLPSMSFSQSQCLRVKTVPLCKDIMMRLEWSSMRRPLSLHCYRLLLDKIVSLMIQCTLLRTFGVVLQIQLRGTNHIW